MTKEEVKKLLKTVDIIFSEKDQSLKVSLPDGVTGNIKKSRHGGFFAEMALPEDRLVVLQYNKKDYKKWATGLTWKAMSTIVFKNTLRAMEIKTAKAGINTVILWKLGDHDKGLIPDLDDFERLADMLKAPASTLNVLWSSAISAEVVQPKIKEIFDPTRWEELRKEVTSQYGITQSIVTGEGGNFSSSFISVQGLLEKLQSIRDLLLEDWIMNEVFIIHKAMGFKRLPRVTFGEMSLKDQAAQNNFVMALYDRGLISDKTLYETLEKDTDIERDRLLDEFDWEDKNNFDRRGPYIKDPQQHVLDEKKLSFDKQRFNKEFEHNKELDKTKLTEDMKIKKMQMKENMKIKKQMVTQQGPNGRPPGSKGIPQKKKRPSKPKNIARTDVENIVNKLDSNAKQYLIAKAGVKDYRALSKEDKNKVLDIVALCLAEMDTNGIESVLELSFIKDNMETTNINFINKWASKASEFVSTNKRKPNKNEIYQMFVDVYLET